MATNYPGSVDTFATDVDNQTSITAAEANNENAAIIALEKYAKTVYNVKTYGGATGNGVTDDTAAIQTCLNAARTGGGGIVYFPPGTYIVTIASRTTGIANSPVALAYGGNTIIMGAGRESSIIRLVANSAGNSSLSTTGASIFQVWGVSQEQMTFADLTVDGNAGNQTDTMHGIQMWRGRGFKLHRVRVMNVRGTNNSGGSTETFGFYATGASDCSFVDCDAIQTAGSMANGFVANGCTNVVYLGCKAASIGAGNAIGFGFNVGTASAGSRQVMYVGCHAYLCGSQGFHIDATNVKNVTYLGCMAGGTASDIVSGQQYPFTSAQSLGNAGPGYICTIAATGISYIGCVAENNTTNGWDLRAGEFELVDCSSNGNGTNGFAYSSAPTVRHHGGAAKTNGASGINFGAASDTNAVRITGGPILSGNTTAAIRIGATNYSAPPANVAAPGVPLTTVALTNQFAFDATVCVTPGASTCAVALDGTATGITLASSGVGQAFRVPAGGTITLTYTSAPTWTWFIE